MLHRMPPTALSRASYPFLFLICLIVSCAVLANAVSEAVRSFSPRGALAVNPYNADARIDLVRNAIVGEDLLPEEKLAEIIADGMVHTPRDARMYSFMGLVDMQKGEFERASWLFRHSLTLLPTEIQALNHSLAFAIQQGRMKDAVDLLEIIGRRWPESWPKVEPALPVMLQDEAARAAITSRFSDEVLRERLIVSLAKQPETLEFAYLILLEWNRLGIFDLTRLINHTTVRFIRNKQYSNAFRLFSLTRAPENAKLGLVYNGSFDYPISGNPFDWILRNQPGVDIRMVTRPQPPGTPVTGNNTLSVQFLNNPIRFDNVSQMTRLAPGLYQLEAVYSAKKLRTPKPLRIGVECQNSLMRIGHTPFESGDVDTSTAAFSFNVPTQGCALQRIHIFNESMTESWKNRYSGIFYLHEVTVSLVSSL